jgi:serine/threonine-protein kinase
MTDETRPTGPLVGAVLDGKYSLVRLLGRGGMGEVYEARHVRIGRRVAVKFLHGELALRAGIASRFENEAKAAGGIEHENIAAVFDVGALPGGTQYLVMELLEGEDLRRVLSREGTLPLIRVADLLIQACNGLDAAHRQGIVHRDLKPANLFLTKRANGKDLLKVLDFGIAKLLDADGIVDATKTGTAVGTPQYMSPEQARGEREIGAQSDVFSLGVILYELLSGRRPYEGESLLEIVHKIVTQPPAPLEQVCPGLPGAVYDVVRKAMATEPSARFHGASELAEALEPFRGASHPSPAPPATRFEKQLETRCETMESPPPSAAPPSVVGVARPALPPRKARNVALGAMAAGAAMAVIAAGAWWTHGTTKGSVAAPEAGLAAPEPSPEPSGAFASGHSSPDSLEPEDAPKDAPRDVRVAAPLASAAPDAASASAAGQAAEVRRKPPPGRVPCKLTHYVDLEGNMHFSTDCPRAAK